MGHVRASGFGTTPFDGLRRYFETVDLVCRECGYEDVGGSWEVETSGDRVVYRHRCPSCDSQSDRTFRIGKTGR